MQEASSSRLLTKTLSVLLSILLCMWAIPAAFADEADLTDEVMAPEADSVVGDSSQDTETLLGSGGVVDSDEDENLSENKNADTDSDIQTSEESDVSFPLDGADNDQSSSFVPSEVIEHNAYAVQEADAIDEVPDDFIGIYTASDLNNIRNDLSRNYILMNDIDLSSWGNWEPIGSIANDGFTGVFDGNSHQINGLTIEKEIIGDSVYVTTDHIGLFSSIVNSKLVKDVTLSNVNIKITINNERVSANIGALAGIANGYPDELYNCNVESGKIDVRGAAASRVNVGGILGTGNEISKSFNNANISADIDLVDSLYVGGIAGNSSGGIDLDQVCNFGDISTNNSCSSYFNEYTVTQCFISGLSPVGNVKDSFNAGNVSSSSASRQYCVCGIGSNAENCYNLGAIDVNVLDPYGFHDREEVYEVSISDVVSAGWFYSGPPVSSYHLMGSASGADYHDDASTPLSESDMQNQKAFVGWDFDSVWKMGNSGYPYPVLRWLDDTPDIDTPTITLPANNELAQLAASALAGFDIGDFYLNVPVSVNVESSAFEDQDTTIWTDSDTRYSEFFKSVLSGYTVVDRENNGTSKYIALKNDETGDIILAFDPDDLLSNIKVAYDALDLPSLSITGIDVFDSSFADRFWKSNTEDIFDMAAWSFNSVSEKFPSSNIYPTGYFVGGMAASYVATLAGIETNVFDGMPDIVIRSAYLTQASTIDADVFHGKNRPVVTNWYNGDSEYAKLFDFQANPFSADSRLSNSVGLRSNSGGKALELTCLFDQYPNGTFCITDEESRTTVNGEPFIENIETNKATISSINKTVTSFFKNDPTLDLGFLKNGPRLVVGTTGDESVHSGRYDSLDQIDKKQVMYSGDGNDYFIGAEKSDVFVLGSGTTVVTGGAGADTYIISGDARGEISDSMCGSALVFADGLKDIMKGFIALSKGDAGSIDKFVASVDKIAEGVAESSDDTIVFRDCPLSEVKVVEDKSASLRGAYYVLQGGNAFITVYKKGLFAKDFKIMGGDGESTELRSLVKGTYNAENGIRVLAENNDSSNGVVTIETYVASGKLHLSSMNDGAIEELSFDGDFQYANDWCNFYYNSENQILSGAYDSDNLNVSFENSEIERIFLNMVKDDISDIQYADDVTCSTVYVGVKDNNDVYLRTDDAEIEMLPVEPVLVDSVTLDKDSVTLVGASSDQLTATISPDDATDKNLVWESSDESVVTVNEHGNIKAVGKGSATITVTASNGITATCAVTVSNPVVKLEISPSEVSVPRGSTVEVELVATGELPGEVDDFKNLAWSFENSDIASITQNGSKVLITGNAVGNTAFAGSINIDNKDIKITGSVAVTKPAPGSIAISESEKTVNVIDDPFVLTASISPDDADYDSVEWASSDPNVVVVDADGTTVIKGVGSASITVKVGDKTAACVVTVVPYVISTTDGSALSASAEITKPALARQLRELQLQIDKIDLASDGRFASLYKGFDGLHVGQYDIYFVDGEGDRVEWSSNETLTVKVPLLNNDLKAIENKDTLSVHHIDDAFEAKTDMKAFIVGEDLAFSTSHFSNYAITAALSDDSGSSDRDSSNENGSNPSNDKGSGLGDDSDTSAADDDAVNAGKSDLAATGDIAISALLSIVALIMACVAVLALQRSRKYASAKHRR